MALLGTKIASKIDQKSIQKGIETKMQFGLGFGALLEQLFWIQLGKLVPKLGKLGSQDDVKKMTEKVECDTTRQKYADGGFPTNPLWVLFS